jgi:hypothetical protein
MKAATKTSPTVTITCTLAELHETIEQAVRIALAATGHKIVTCAGRSDDAKARELGRNAAGALMMFCTDEG